MVTLTEVEISPDTRAHKIAEARNKIPGLCNKEFHENAQSAYTCS